MKTKTNFSMTLGITLGVLCSLEISVMLLAITTKILIGGKFDFSTSQLWIHIVRFFSVFIGVLFSSIWTKEKYLVVSGLVTLVYVLLLSLLCVLVFDSAFRGFWIGMFSALLGGGVGCLVSLKLQHRPRSRVKIKK